MSHIPILWWWRYHILQKSMVIWLAPRFIITFIISVFISHLAAWTYPINLHCIYCGALFRSTFQAHFSPSIKLISSYHIISVLCLCHTPSGLYLSSWGFQKNLYFPIFVSSIFMARFYLNYMARPFRTCGLAKTYYFPIILSTMHMARFSTFFTLMKSRIFQLLWRRFKFYGYTIPTINTD